MLARLPRLPRGLEEWLLDELRRARATVHELQHDFPDDDVEAVARRLIDRKKSRAAAGGALAGAFGLWALPADLAYTAWLQASLVVELSVLYNVNLRGGPGRQALAEAMGFQGSFGPLPAALPSIAGKVGTALVRRLAGGGLGRLVPIVAAPVGAIFNRRELERVGRSAIRTFSRFRGRAAASEDVIG